MIPNYLQTEFEKIINRSYLSKKIRPIREKAFNSLMIDGLPQKKSESWRFTDLSSIKNGHFSISDKNDAPKKFIKLPKYGFESFKTIVIYNGHYQEDISSLPDGIELLSNIDYMEKHSLYVKQPYMSSFDLLNTAFMDSGMSLVIRKKEKVSTPLRLLFIYSGSNNIMVSPRIHLDLEHSSSLFLLEQHVGNCDEYLYNGSIIANIEEGAKLEHVRIQNNSKKTINISNHHIQQKQQSIYRFNQIAFGSSLGRVNLHANLIGQGADCSLNGLSLSSGKQHLDSNITINHQASYCKSNQDFRFILKDRSSGVFNGRAIVQEGAEKTDSNQSNKNLLLSEHALMNSNPQLEIYNDDVKCSHGSTTGSLDNDALFYLRSRGIKKDDAIGILVRGFASKKVDSIKNDEIQTYVNEHFDKWLN